MKLEGDEIQATPDRLERQIKKIEEAPGSSMHIDLMRLYLDQMDKKIMNGLEVNYDISLRAIKTQEKTIEMHKCHNAQLELEATNKILHDRLHDAKASPSK
jgi:exonuclease V gamma subunit